MSKTVIKKSTQTAKHKLNIISDVWQHFFWEYSYGRSAINFNAETQTSYLPDLINYLEDTLILLHKSPPKKYNERLLYTTGILQLIYVQQDLIGELLYVFAFDTDKILAQDANRKINRDLRNELVGHPIRRDKTKKHELISTVFLKENSSSDIHYVLYSKQDNFSGNLISHNFTDIIQRHLEFIHTYLDFIIEKLRLLLQRFRTILVNLQDKLLQDIPFEKKVKLSFKIFESIKNENYLYSESILIEAFNRKDKHKRYSNVIELYEKELHFLITEKIKWTEEAFEKQVSYGRKHYKPIKITITIAKGPPAKKKARRTISYDLAKLHGKHPVWGTGWFRKQFKRNKKVLCELDNMEANMNSNLEYYASFEYIKTLVSKLR